MKSLQLLFVTSALAIGCSNSKPANDPGPAQKAGAAVDEGARDAKESAKEAGEKVGEASKKAGDKLQEKGAD
ncbi:MAG: hypothetical protein WDO74_06170 [Pseudomonadota bacterium]